MGVPIVCGECNAHAQSNTHSTSFRASNSVKAEADYSLRQYQGQWHNQKFCSGGGFQQIQLRTEDRQNGDLGAVAP